MRLYTIHEGPADADGAPRLGAIKEGFCWPALFLTAIWSLWHGLWLVTAAIAAADLAIGWALSALGADPTVQSAVNIAIAVAIGLLANDLRRWTLTGRGYAETAIVAAPDAEAALHRYLTAQPEPAPETEPQPAPFHPVLPPAPPEPFTQP